MYKKLISFLLLAFVAFSIAFLVYKEFSQRRVIPKNQTDENILSSSKSIEDKNSDKKNDIEKNNELKEAGVETSEVGAETETEKEEKVSVEKNPEKKEKQISPQAKSSTSTITEKTKIEVKEEKEQIVPEQKPKKQENESKIIAYYFHTTSRCYTCLKIEEYSREAVEEYFSKEIKNKTIEFKTINVEEPENKHFIQDYQLYTKSLIITLWKDDKQIKYKNLSDVWTYVRNKDEFMLYVKNEVENFIKELM